MLLGLELQRSGLADIDGPRPILKVGSNVDFGGKFGNWHQKTLIATPIGIVAAASFLALLARLAAWWLLAPSPDFLLASAHHEHASIAKSLALGEGFRFNFFGTPDRPVLTSQQAPFVPYLLASLYSVFGIESPTSLRALVLIQVMVASLAAGLLVITSYHVTQQATVAGLVGCLFASYPPFVVASLHLQALAWNLPWLAMLLAGTVLQKKGIRRAGACWFVAGGTGGVLTDPILGIVVAGLLAGLLLSARFDAPDFQRQQLRGPLILGLLIALFISPWLIRGFIVHGRFVFIKDSFNYVFWQGNTLMSAGTDKLLVSSDWKLQLLASTTGIQGSEIATLARQNSQSINETLTEKDLHELQRLPDEISRMDWFGRRIRDELADHPRHYFKMCWIRFWQWCTFDSTNPRSYLWPYRLPYLLLALLALAALPTQLQHCSRWWPVLYPAVALTLVHTLVITSARFRILFELLLIPGAALTLVEIVRFGLRQSREIFMPTRKTANAT